jgi:sortase (surface protein transpeptidase)
VAALAAAVALAIAGVLLLWVGPTHQVHSAHPQPLPEQPFAIAPDQARTLPAAAGSQTGSCTPEQVRPLVAIPALCVSAPVVTTAVDRFGSLNLPDDVHLVALDADSAPLSARRGTTVIAGHVDNRDQGPGAFYPLYRTPPGAAVTVTDANGHTSSWRVFKVISVDKNALPADLQSHTGPRELVLVTCGGALSYVPGYGYSYDDNVLVYATPA